MRVTEREQCMVREKINLLLGTGLRNLGLRFTDLALGGHLGFLGNPPLFSLLANRMISPRVTPWTGKSQISSPAPQPSLGGSLKLQTVKQNGVNKHETFRLSSEAKTSTLRLTNEAPGRHCGEYQPRKPSSSVNYFWKKGNHKMTSNISPHPLPPTHTCALSPTKKGKH